MFATLGSGILQSEVIDVAEWPTDELFYNYPEGARSKTAVFRPDNLKFSFIKAKRRYLYKRSDKRYPDQFWGEIVAYHVGCLLQVNVPPAYAALNSKDGDCAALIEWFYEDDKARFDPGGLFMQRLIPDFDRKRGLQHNFSTVLKIGERFEEAGILVKPWIHSWAELFLFDALIGNTDRHQDNWGVMLSMRKKILRVEFSPLFDNGTSLGHERWPDRVQGWPEARFEKYVSDGRHHIRWEIQDTLSCGHSSVLTKLCAKYPDVKGLLQSKIASFNIDILAATIAHLSELHLPIALTKERKDLYIKLISLRKRDIELALQ